jgi:hypothetical protein
MLTSCTNRQLVCCYTCCKLHDLTLPMQLTICASLLLASMSPTGWQSSTCCTICRAQRVTLYTTSNWSICASYIYMSPRPGLTLTGAATSLIDDLLVHTYSISLGGPYPGHQRASQLSPYCPVKWNILPSQRLSNRLSICRNYWRHLGLTPMYQSRYRVTTKERWLSHVKPYRAFTLKPST